ncbi:hypothetical protein Dimus_007990 [Dionaea muscipula]
MATLMMLSGHDQPGRPSRSCRRPRVPLPEAGRSTVQPWMSPSSRRRSTAKNSIDELPGCSPCMGEVSRPCSAFPGSCGAWNSPGNGSHCPPRFLVRNRLRGGAQKPVMATPMSLRDHDLVRETFAELPKA